MSEDDGSEQPKSTNVDGLRDRLREALQSASRQYPAERKRAEDSAKGGFLSRIIGDTTHHAGSIAFISVIGLLTILGGTLWALFYGQPEYNADYFENVKSIVQALMTLIGTILGYLFGRSKDG